MEQKRFFVIYTNQQGDPVPLIIGDGKLMLFHDAACAVNFMMEMELPTDAVVQIHKWKVV